jgi:hypothetical protein
MIDGGDKRVEQAGIVAPAVEVAQPLEELLGILSSQVAGPLDSDLQQLPGDSRADVR